MDVFIEQIVAKKPDSRDSFLKICLLIGTVALCGIFGAASYIFAQLSFVAITAIAAIPGAIWLGVQFIKGLGVEYEYILTNKELDIDKITGKSKRRRMVTFDLSNAVELNLYDQTATQSALANADVTVFAHDNTYTNMWYLVVKHDAHGKTVLLFNPDNEFAAKLNKALPMRARNKSISNAPDDSNNPDQNV